MEGGGGREGNSTASWEGLTRGQTLSPWTFDYNRSLRSLIYSEKRFILAHGFEGASPRSVGPVASGPVVGACRGAHCSSPGQGSRERRSLGSHSAT